MLQFIGILYCIQPQYMGNDLIFLITIIVSDGMHACCHSQPHSKILFTLSKTCFL